MYSNVNCLYIYTFTLTYLLSLLVYRFADHCDVHAQENNDNLECAHTQENNDNLECAHTQENNDNLECAVRFLL